MTDAMLASDPRWGICGVSLKSPRVCDALEPQDGLYSVLEKSVDATTSARGRVGARGAVPRRPSATGCSRGLADPGVEIVSLTVTEKGYCHDPATGRLNFEHPEIVHDLANPAGARRARSAC